MFYEVTSIIEVKLLDLNRLKKKMQEQDLKGLLVMTPSSNILYSTETSLPVAAIFPKDEEPVAVAWDWAVDVTKEKTWIKDVRAYESWIYFEKWGQLPRKPGDVGSKPQQFEIYPIIAEAIKEKGLARGRIGVELESMSVHAYEKLKKIIPDAKLVDVSSPQMTSGNLWWQMRMIKSQDEIETANSCTNRRRRR